jgi:16S rRNA processing protein RimM
MNDVEWAILARLVRPQGRHGEILADLLTDFPERFAERRRLFLVVSETSRTPPREVTLERHWLHKGRVVLKFVGVDSISDASPFARWRVAIPREERAPLADDAVYVADLIGCHLIDEAGGAVDLGPVLDVERGAGDALDILVLNSGEDELLIPFAKAYLVSLDLDARVVRMRLPAGLTTINAPMTEEERAAQRQASQKDEADDAL